MRNFAIDGEIARMEKTLVSFTDIDAETLDESLSDLDAGESLDELTESLLRRYVESRDVTIAAKREKVGRAVARAFREGA